MSILGLVYLASSETCALAPQAAPNDILSEALAFSKDTTEEASADFLEIIGFTPSLEPSSSIVDSHKRTHDEAFGQSSFKQSLHEKKKKKSSCNPRIESTLLFLKDIDRLVQNTDEDDNMIFFCL